MSSTRRLDLDAALEERQPLTITFKGKEYTLPGGVPARAVLKYVTVFTPGGGVPGDKLFPFLEDLIGEDTLNSLLEDGLEYKDLERLLQWLLREYKLVTDENTEEEGVVSPNPQA